MDLTRISYVSDLHLDGLCERKKLIGQKRIDYVNGLADRIVEEATNVVLFAGDYSDDYYLLGAFLKRLDEAISVSNKEIIPVFIFGNHEEMSNIRTTVSLFIRKNIYLLVDELLVINADDSILRIRYPQFENDPSSFAEQLNKAKLVIFGSFEPINGRKSPRWLSFQNASADFLKNVPVIILTHYPVQRSLQKKGWVYVWGHTNRQQCYDDGINRFYADNQWIGLYSQHLKSFSLEYSNVKDSIVDGISIITKVQYQDIFRAITKKPLNIPDKFINIHALKAGQYYCFIGETTKGYCILNGGLGKSLDNCKSLQFYYDHLREKGEQLQVLSSTMKNNCQSVVSLLKTIDGTGILHGCIIDYDELHHVFYNPQSGDMTCYHVSGTRFGNKKMTVFSHFEDFLDAIESTRQRINKYIPSIKAIQITDSIKSIAKRSPYSPTLPDDFLTISNEAAMIQKIDAGIVAIWDTQYFVAK